MTLETAHISKAGVLVPIEVNANAIAHNGQYFNFALVRDITDRKRIEAQLLYQASYDMLTGLPNRRLLVDKLSDEISKAKRTGGNVAILFIDLDRFKEINDTLGHHQGDQLLIQVAQRIQKCVRESDTLARMGGDEFLVILSGVTEMMHLGRVAQSIIDAMTSPFVLDNQISYVSASIGIANYPSDIDSLEGLISAADQAMYVAKERGRNCFSFFTPAMQMQVQQRLSLANDLREALHKRQLQIYLQPIVNISTGLVVKAEALLRWKHPQHGMVPPDMFIPIAEETGMIHEIGDWVFHQAAHTMSRWLGVCAAKNDCCQISVNMSPRQFIPNEIGTAWIKHLETINVPTSHMVIEITESLLLGDEVDIMEKLHRFRQAGIKVALDDFGTGYSAMSYLKKFNIDYLKIDRSFVRDLETDTNDRAITEAIVVMAHKLGLKTIAEGVETEQQKSILAEVGCDYVQGYLYAKPMPVEEFLSFVTIKA
jgi:diguanylate cyclase (GGDEF)-like protein